MHPSDFVGLSDEDCPPGFVSQPGPLGHFACVPASLASQSSQAAPAPPSQPAAGTPPPALGARTFVVGGAEVPGWVLAGGALAAGYVAWHTWFRRKPKRKKKKPAA